MKAFRKIQRPDKTEYPEYSQPYFDFIKTDDNILQELHDNFIKLKEFIYSLPSETLNYRYAKDKWTIKEILLHNIDDERIFTYRALCYARNDKTPLPGFEEKEYATYSGANQRSLDSIFDEYWNVRLSTLKLFQYLPEDAFMRTGNMIGEDGKPTNERTVRALLYHIAGHELSHIKVIKERYLGIQVDKFPI
jgi:hypothetical protein